MAINLDPLKPYVGLIKLLGVLVVASVVFVGGCRYGENKSAGVIAEKNVALGMASAELRSAADALRAVNAEAKRRKAEAERLRLATADAAKAAAEAERVMRERQVKFEKALRNARNNPPCAALLNADLRATCGL